MYYAENLEGRTRLNTKADLTEAFGDLEPGQWAAIRRGEKIPLGDGPEEFTVYDPKAVKRSTTKEKALERVKHAPPARSEDTRTAEGGATFEQEVRWAIDAILMGNKDLALERLNRVLKRC